MSSECNGFRQSGQRPGAMTESVYGEEGLTWVIREPTGMQSISAEVGPLIPSAASVARVQGQAWSASGIDRRTDGRQRAKS